MLHFFRASSWSLQSIRQRRFEAVKEYAPLYQKGEFHVLIGDGVKQSKEGCRIPLSIRFHDGLQQASDWEKS